MRCGVYIPRWWITGLWGGGGSQDQSNWWGSDSTHFHRPNVVSCEILWKMSDVKAVRGVETLYDVVVMVVLVLGLGVLMNNIGID